MSVKILKASEVGLLITKVIKSAQEVGNDLHNVMVQCALHVREHGDTSLASRLVKEIQDSGASAALNLQGVRYWFGMACPMVIDRKTGGWKLIDKDSDTYTKYIDRMLLQTSGEHKDPGKGEPDKTTGPGARIFFVDWCSEHPFWSDERVKGTQRQNIRVIGLENVIGMGFAIEQQVRKAQEQGLFLPDATDAVNEYITAVKKLGDQFTAKYAAEIVGERRALTEFKAGLQEARTEEVKDEAIAEQVVAEVGGNVAEGIEQQPGGVQENEQVAEEPPAAKTA